MKVKVNDGWQLGVDDGKVYQPGDVFDAPKELAEQYINAGQASAVKAEAKAEGKMVESAKNKAVAAPESETKFTGTPKTEKK